ncbi:MAG: stage II sporulation protein R [Clostridia bacterium]|nr:stage II sporulation protein R [Clostridia bacterium]
MKRFWGFFMAAAMLVAAFLILPIHGEAGIYDNVIRLHVLANSDSEEDQAIKLTVRDAVTEKTQMLLQNVNSRAEAEAVLHQSLPLLEDAAREALRQAGSADAVAVTLSEERYPTRQYESLAFPAGEYLSLRVMIGEAEGQNWWCVLFPPLCLSAASAQDTEAVCLSAGLTGEQYRVIADTDSTTYKLRFKILEVAEAIFG